MSTERSSETHPIAFYVPHYSPCPPYILSIARDLSYFRTSSPVSWLVPTSRTGRPRTLAARVSTRPYPPPTNAIHHRSQTPSRNSRAATPGPVPSRSSRAPTPCPVASTEHQVEEEAVPGSPLTPLSGPSRETTPVNTTSRARSVTRRVQFDTPLPKPKGSPNRPESGGYSLEKEMGLSKKDYEAAHVSFRRIL